MKNQHPPKGIRPYDMCDLFGKGPRRPKRKVPVSNFKDAKIDKYIAFLYMTKNIKVEFHFVNDFTENGDPLFCNLCGYEGEADAVDEDQVRCRNCNNVFTP